MVNIAKIEALIKEKGWSNSYFCSLFSKNRGWIRDWKRGVGLPDKNLLNQIADKLDTTVEYLTDQTDKKEKPIVENDNELNELLEIFDQLSAAKRKKLLAQARLEVDEQNAEVK